MVPLLLRLRLVLKWTSNNGAKTTENGQSEKVQQLAFKFFFFILPLELKTFRCIYVCEEMDSCHCVWLGQSIVPNVGKSFKLILVDLFDYTVVHWCQDRLFPCEVLVEVIHIPFGFLETQKQSVYFRSEITTAVDTSEARPANSNSVII